MQVITSSQVYWITRLDDARVVFGFVIFACVVHCICRAIAWGVKSEDHSCYGVEASSASDFCRGARRLFILSLIFPFLLGAIPLALIPTTKDMCAIIVIPKIANNSDVQEVSSEIVDLAKSWLKELSPERVMPDEKK